MRNLPYYRVGSKNTALLRLDALNLTLTTAMPFQSNGPRLVPQNRRSPKLSSAADLPASSLCGLDQSLSCAGCSRRGTVPDCPSPRFHLWIAAANVRPLPPFQHWEFRRIASCCHIASNCRHRARARPRLYLPSSAAHETNAGRA